MKEDYSTWIYCKAPRDMPIREFLAHRERYLPAEWALPKIKAPALAKPKFGGKVKQK